MGYQRHEKKGSFSWKPTSTPKLKWRYGGQWQVVCPSPLWCRAPAQKLIKAGGP